MYEMKELRPKGKQRESQSKVEDINGPDTKPLNPEAIWAYSTSSFFLATSLLLLLLPDSLLFLVISQPSGDDYGPPRSRMTYLETFLSTQLGLLTMALGLAILFSIPSDNPGLSKSVVGEQRNHPLLYPITFSSIFSTLIGIKGPREIGAIYKLVTTITCIMSIWGLWLIVFRKVTQRRARKTT